MNENEVEVKEPVLNASMNDLVISENENFSVAAEIGENIADENLAISKYLKLLQNPKLTLEDKEQIEEIISDEKNHRVVLAEMQNKYDDIETNED